MAYQDLERGLRDIVSIHVQAAIDGNGPFCEECRRRYPCQTVRIADTALSSKPFDPNAARERAARGIWPESEDKANDI